MLLIGRCGGGKAGLGGGGVRESGNGEARKKMLHLYSMAFDRMYFLNINICFCYSA